MPRGMISVICISHTDGSGGDEVGRTVAAALDYRYVNEDLIIEAARLARVDPSVMAAAEQKQSLLQRVMTALESIKPSAQATAPAADARASKEDLRTMIRAAIQEVKKEGKAVIGAHAASMALAGQRGVLRVFVTAPAVVRSRRVGKHRALPPAVAEDVVEKADAARAEYLRTFYEIPVEQPTHYDLVLNTEHLTAQQAAALVVAAARG
jgi:hypothetical protein